MTYIKWKDEVESYLGNLSQEEKQKIFSYFSEMYADKRDAGKSEAQIIEEFGAPYDVAKRILEGNKESADTSEAPSNVTGGSNYNYNYYNYNYGGAPQTPPQETQQTPPPVAQQPAYRQSAAQQQNAQFQNGIPAPYVQSGKPEEKSSGKTAGEIIVLIVLIALNVGLAITAAVAMCRGWTEIGVALGAAAAGKCTAGETLSDVGLGLLNVGGSLLLFAGVSALAMAIKKKIKADKGDKR